MAMSPSGVRYNQPESFPGQRLKPARPGEHGAIRLFIHGVPPDTDGPARRAPALPSRPARAAPIPAPDTADTASPRGLHPPPGPRPSRPGCPGPRDTPRTPAAPAASAPSASPPRAADTYSSPPAVALPPRVSPPPAPASRAPDSPHGNTNLLSSSRIAFLLTDLRGVHTPRRLSRLGVSPCSLCALSPTLLFWCMPRWVYGKCRSLNAVGDHHPPPSCCLGWG